MDGTTCLVGMWAMTEAVDPELIGIVKAAVDGDDVAFGRIVAAHHDDMRRLRTFVAGDQSLAVGCDSKGDAG